MEGPGLPLPVPQFQSVSLLEMGDYFYSPLLVVSLSPHHKSPLKCLHSKNISALLDLNVLRYEMHYHVFAMCETNMQIHSAKTAARKSRMFQTILL